MNQNEQLFFKLKQLGKLTATYVDFETNVDFFKIITDDLLKLSDAAFVAINLLEEDNYVTKKISISGDKKYLDKAELIFEFDIIGKQWPLNDTKKFINNEIGLIKHEGLDVFNNYFSKSINDELVSKYHLGNAYSIAISKNENKLGLFVIIMPAGGDIEFPQIIESFTQTVGALLYRIETEKILLQKYQTMQIISYNAPDLHILVDENYKVTYINKVLPGYSIDKVVGDDVLNYVFPDYRDDYLRWLKRAFKNKIEINESVTAVGPNGEPAEYDVKFIPLSLNDGTTLTYIIAKDITESKATHEKLQESEEQIRYFFKNASDAVIIIDEEGIIINWNPKAQEVFGWQAEEVIGNKLDEFIIPERHKDGHIWGMEYFLKTGEGKTNNNSTEISAVKKNGEELDVFLNISDTMINGRKFFIGFVNDVTDKKNSAKAIKESEHRFRQITETINDVFYLYNIVDKRYEFISPNCKDILGVDVEFFLSGKSYTQMYVHVDDKKKMIEANALINSGIPYEKEFRVLIDNKERWLKEKSFPIKDSEGRAIKNSGIITDVTDKKQAFENQARQLDFQRIVAETSTQFLNSTTAAFNETANLALQILGKFFQADRSYILRYNESSWTLNNTHEWCAKGISSMKQHIQDVPTNDLPWLFGKMITMKPLHIPNIDQLPIEAKAEKLEFQRQEIKSLLSIPLHDRNNRLTGIIGMDMVTEAYSWSDSEINMLQIVADVVSSAIIRIDFDKQLIESEEKKSSILSSMDDLVFVLDKNFVFQEYHYSGSDDLLMDPEFFLGKGFDDVDFPEPAFSDIKNVMQRCLLTKIPCNTIYYLDLPKGKKWFDLKATILKDSEGEVKGLTIVTRDITDRKLTEELLILNSKEVRDINVAVDENSLVSITDTKGVILKANEKFCKLSKYKEEELIGKTHAVINSGYHSKDFWKDVWSTIGKGNIWKGEVKNRAKDGSYYWVQSVINPIFDKKGKIVRYLSIRQDITEQKKIELNLRDSESKLLMAHQIAKLGHWALDLVNSELKWSDSIFDIFSIDKNKFKASYEGFLEAIHPEDRDMVNDAYSNSLISKKPYEVVHRLLNNDQIKWVKESCHTDFDRDGKPLRSIGIVQDITASKTDEIELQHTKDLLDRTNKVARIGGWEVDLINNSIYWTEITKEIHGVGLEYEPDLETAMNFFKEGVSRKLITAAVNKAIDEGEGYDLELQIITRQKKELWVKALGQAEIKDGKAIRLYGTFQDINVAKEAELQIIRQNEFRKLIADISSAFVKTNEENLIDNEIHKVLKKCGLHFDADRCFLYQVSSQNNSIYKTHDWNSTDSKNRTSKKLSINKFPWLTKIIKKKSELIINDITDIRVRASAEYREWKKEKIKSLILIRFNVNDRPIGLLGLSTSKKHVVWNEEQISGLGVVANIFSDALSKYVLEKVLIDAKEKAENANRLKTIFLGNLSHEVRTPLQGIMGVTELLETPNLSNEKTREFIKLIKRRAIDMQNIIESLLDMASLETGEIQAFPVETNLHEIIETIFVKTQQDNADFAESVKYNLENKIDQHALVFLDPQHLHQVLTNFVKNAFKFTNEGSIQIICYRKVKAYNIDVIDTGIGISPEKIDYIFEPFRQAHEGLSRSKGGIGLGLSICKKMVDMWGGMVAVKSEPNVGSTFTFTIPSKY